MPDPKRVAAVVTEYRRWSHADVIVGKILEGFHYDNKDRPRMRLASLYVDQFPKGDMSRALAQKYKFPIFRTIEGALTLGRKGLNVDGVLCIGEHGRYPSNARGQILYPRRLFFEVATKVFQRAGRRHVTGTDEPAMNGTNRARARSYIQRASAQLTARCLSLKTGTDRPVRWKTLVTSSKKRRRG